MNKTLLASAFLLILIFVTGLNTSTLAWPDPDIQVTPLSHYFGEVAIGALSTTIITISNVGGYHLVIDDIVFQSGSNSDFSITPPPALPVVIEPMDGGVYSIEVGITYSPSVEGPASAVLQIYSNDPVEPVVDVILSGIGVIYEPPPPVSIADILAFFDESVDNGSLIGNGPGKSAERRLDALRNQIEAAGDLIDDGLIEEACQQLMVAYTRADGLGPPGSPPDFVAGSAASELARMIMNLWLSLGC